MGDDGRGRLAGRGALLGRLTAAVTAGRPTVLVGPAGIGKTALLRAAAAGGQLFEGGGLASLSWCAYLPVARAAATRCCSPS